MSSKHSTPEKRASTTSQLSKGLYEIPSDPKYLSPNYSSIDSARSSYLLAADKALLDKYRSPSLPEPDNKNSHLIKEIERLTKLNKDLLTENESLRFAKSQKEKELEDKLGIMIDENDRLNRMLAEKDKTRVIDLTQYSYKDNDEIRKLLNSLQSDKSYLSEQVTKLQLENEDLRRKYISGSNLLSGNEDKDRKIQILSMEIDGLKKTCENFQRENIQLRSTYHDRSYYTDQISRLQLENEELRKKWITNSTLLATNEDKDRKIQLLVMENDALKKSCDKLQRDNTLLATAQHDKNYLTEQVTRLQQENEDLRKKWLSNSVILAGNEEKDRKIQLLVMESDALKKSCETLQKENSQLSLFLKEKSGQLEKALLQTDTLQKENTDLYKNVSGLKNQLITMDNQLNNQIQNLMAENTDLKRRQYDYDQNKALLNEMTNRNTALLDENKKLANALQDHAKLNAEYESLRNKIGLLIQENDRLLANNADKAKEIAGLKASNDALTIELNRQKEELQLKGTTSDYEIQSLKRKAEELSKKTEELGALKGQLSVLTLDNDRLSRALEEKKKECEGLTKTRDDWIRVSGELEGWKRKYEVISIDYKRIEDELKSLRNNANLQYESLKNQNTSLLNDNHRLSDELNNLLRSSGVDSELLKMRNDELNARNKELDELKGKFSLLILENERLTRIIDAQTIENNLFKNSKEGLSKDLEAQRNLNNSIMNDYRNMKEELNNLKGAYDKETSAYKKQVSDLTNDKARLTDELNRRGNATEAELTVLRKKAEELSEARMNIAILAIENDRLHRLILSLTFEIEKNEKEILFHKQRIDELIRENDNIRMALTTALRDLEESQIALREFQKRKAILDDARSRVKNVINTLDIEAAAAGKN